LGVQGLGFVMLRTHPVFEERLGQIEVVGFISKEWNIFTYCSNMFKIHQNTTGQHVIFSCGTN
jgi:hypothetical protein